MFFLKSRICEVTAELLDVLTGEFWPLWNSICVAPRQDVHWSLVTKQLLTDSSSSGSGTLLCDTDGSTEVPVDVRLAGHGNRWIIDPHL